ncbi:MAG: hypothetical protein RLZZ158_561 [Cyanobacteriota bacterium]|jgi:diguanylate cyclase (GGDEF)-like protein
MKQIKLNSSSRLILSLAIGAAAYAINLLNIPLFFGVNILLGQSLAVFLTLQWQGPWGVLAGCLAAFATWSLWGHPWAVIICALEQLALYYWINFRRAEFEAREDGSVILIDMIFWLLIGMPLVWFFYSGILNMDSANVNVVAIKQAVNGVINSAIGLLLYLGLRLLILKINGPKFQNNTNHGISVRGIIFAIVFTCISLPTLFNTVLNAQEVSQAVQAGVEHNLRLNADSIINDLNKNMKPESDGSNFDLDSLHAHSRKINYQIALANGSKYSNNPALFESLSNKYKDGGRQFIKIPDLSIMITKNKVPLLKKWINGYWLIETDWPKQADSSIAYKSIQIVEPARETVVQMQKLSTETLYNLAAVLVIAVLISEILARSFQLEFSLLIAPFLPESKGSRVKQVIGLPLLSMSAITEFSKLASLVNERIIQTDRLTKELQDSNKELASSRDKLSLLSTTDELTGCMNRRKLDEILEQELARGRRTGEPLCCATLDIDYFKRVNDNYGHLSGDKILCSVANQTQQRLRSTDYLCRFGGDEFVIILPACPLKDALSIMEDLRQAIDSTIHEVDGTNCKVSLSVGVTLADYQSDTCDSLIKRSDDALFKAKQNGRNRVIHKLIAS